MANSTSYLNGVQHSKNLRSYNLSQNLDLASNENRLILLQENGSESKVKEEPEDEQEQEVGPTAFVCTPDQLDKLAENLAQIENWNKLIPILGMTEENLQKIFEEKKITETKGLLLIFCSSFLRSDCCFIKVCNGC